MRILFIGDVFGKPGRKALSQWLPNYRMNESVDLVIANGENSAGGKGISRATADEMTRAGVDVFTGGNHSFAQREAAAMMDQDPRILRPANLPPGAPGQGIGFYPTPSGHEVAVLNLMGRTFMKPIDCPFRMGRSMAEEALRRTSVLIVDFHAEATSEKIGLAIHLDGFATAVIGTHTHVQTNDARISPRGTAAITDVGMTGPHDSIIGVISEIALSQFLTGLPSRHEVASGDVRINGLLLDVDPKTGRALKVAAVQEPGFVRERPA